MQFKDLRRKIRLRAARGLPGVMGWLPEAWGRRFCGLVGLCAHDVVGRDRRLARENLARVHPSWPRGRVRREARQVFVELGKNVYDFLRYPGLSPEAQERLVEIEGREHLDALRGQGRGALLVAGHLGCWEILAAALVREGYPMRALARPLGERGLESALCAHRRRMGVRTYSSRRLPLAALRHLRRGGFLGLLADQRVHGSGVTVDFFGQATRWTEAPARLALVAGVPLVPLGIHRRSDHRHRITVLPPLAPPRSPADVPAVTREVAQALESLIRLAPAQWMWIHPRWEPAASGRAPLALSRTPDPAYAIGPAFPGGVTDNSAGGDSACASG